MAAQPYQYSGQGFSLLRDKGRFVLPPQFRKTVRESSGGNALCITRHDRWKCLTGFGLSRRETFDAQLDREESLAAQAGREYDRELRSVQLNGFTEIPYDESGRFVLPTYLADLVGITDQFYCQGAGPFFVIFAPEELEKMGAGWEGAQAACRQLAADALAKVRK